MGVPIGSPSASEVGTVKRRRIILDRSPVAFTTQGRLVIGVHVVMDGDFNKIVEVAREMGGRIFVGVAVDGRLRDRMLKDIDDLSWDSAARFGADLRRRRGGRS